MQLDKSKDTTKNQILEAALKVFVKSGDSKNVTITLPIKELAYYSEVKKEWVVEPGTYNLKIGKSSRDIIQEIQISIVLN